MASKKPSSTPAELLKKLEQRHDQLLDQLDELNELVEAALTDVSGDKSETIA